MILEGLPTQLTNMANAFHSLVCFFLILKMYSSDGFQPLYFAQYSYHL